MQRRRFLRSSLAGALSAASLFSVSRSASAARAAASATSAEDVIALRTMGSFAFGGTIARDDQSVTFHGDHGYAQYYVAPHSRTLPIVMWHGIGQSGKTYESTPDGREGYQALLPRRDWSVYIVDQPRRGRAGYTQAKFSGPEIPTTASEAGVWDAFRNGLWVPPAKPKVWTDTQFPLSGAAVDQFFRQQTPSTGNKPQTPEFRELMGKTGAALFDRIGDGILITHSNSGQYGWEIAMASPKVKAIVAYEPGACAFPNEMPPEDVPAKTKAVADRLFPRMVPMARWQALTKIPILIVFGDHISDEPSEIFNVDVWRVARARARQFVELVNAQRGDATLLELPKLGIRGNTHAAFADKNNVEILNLMTKWFAEKHLDGYEHPHTGPKPVEMPMSLDLETMS